MKIVQISNTKWGEVAYIYDEEQGRVFKVAVDDLTNTGYDGDDRPEMPARRPRMPVRRVPVRAPEEGVEEEYPEPEPPPTPQPMKPRVAPKSIIPPHLAGVFRKPGTAGAAEERREM